ncbi:hypothetical protein ANANG_G00015270 [Anguilla anguilla]|uniref:Uncharacterized protein n=1 Tax=Anguilla anguilla TaxID=7936 RepID=A0A9D3S6Z8_ANGAN|nr:hypothetical protein ANANG_G00015270 [Anguilla anguilla]
MLNKMQQEETGETCICPVLHIAYLSEAARCTFVRTVGTGVGYFFFGKLRFWDTDGHWILFLNNCGIIQNAGLYVLSKTKNLKPLYSNGWKTPWSLKHNKARLEVRVQCKTSGRAG